MEAEIAIPHILTKLLIVKERGSKTFPRMKEGNRGL
jgi:hypothetical protein